MRAVLAGPMFQPAADSWRESVFGAEGAHYNIFLASDPDVVMQKLREWFPGESAVNAMNFVLFSTSGVHGSGITLEEIEASTDKYGFEDDPRYDEFVPPVLTFLVVQPRLVGMTYGNLRIRNKADLEWLKWLRDRSAEAVARIGR